MPSSVPPLVLPASSVLAVDEGLDRLVRLDLVRSRCEWLIPLATKARSLQRVEGGRRVLVVTDQGWLEVDVETGRLCEERRPFASGLISVQRLAEGDTFCGGLDLLGRKGVCFVQLEGSGLVRRSVVFEGDYVRRASLTPQDTILFTCDTRVLEGTWEGRVLRSFSLPGFRHAWKPLRLRNGHTLISAGYGAFVAEFDRDGTVCRRWECREHVERVRPFFFGDYEVLDDGSLLVCNWLGHGHDLGDSGCSLLHFDPESRLLGAWKDARLASSLQSFVRLA